MYGTFTLYGVTFQTLPLSLRLSLARLLPVRSPLLGESRLISFPPGTEMFHFPGFALSEESDTDHSVPGCPIRKSTDQRLLATPRGLSQPSTSFIASISLGIHRLL